jgi:small-conductance mechanosensitive channel
MTVLLYTIIPVLAVILGSISASLRRPSASFVSAMQHLAAGVVFAAAATEILPQVMHQASPAATLIGGSLGVGTMLALKAIEVVIFGAAFLLLMSIMGIDLTAVAVLGGALGVGIGLGLQQIAANFVSGIILLIEGQTTVGDYVELDGGEKGTIVKMTARACILETFDGKWIVVPNDHFITTRVINYSDQGSENRYAVAFSVAYETDITLIPELIKTAVAELAFVLKKPYGPDCELESFGESSVDFTVKYWVSGIDDGRNNYASQVRFAIWNALKSKGISMPYPHRVIEMRGPAQ